MPDYSHLLSIMIKSYLIVEFTPSMRSDKMKLKFVIKGKMRLDFRAMEQLLIWLGM